MEKIDVIKYILENDVNNKCLYIWDNEILEFTRFVWKDGSWNSVTNLSEWNDTKEILNMLK